MRMKRGIIFASCLASSADMRSRLHLTGASQARELSDFVANYTKTLEISDLEARLQRLEAANGTRR